MDLPAVLRRYKSDHFSQEFLICLIPSLNSMIHYFYPIPLTLFNLWSIPDPLSRRQPSPTPTTPPLPQQPLPCSNNPPLPQRLAQHLQAGHVFTDFISPPGMEVRLSSKQRGPRTTFQPTDICWPRLPCCQKLRLGLADLAVTGSFRWVWTFVC